jgi:hypothetical protein
LDPSAVAMRPCIDLTPRDEVEHCADKRALLLSTARTDAERAFVNAWLDSASTSELAKVLGIEHKSKREQQRAAHTLKMRLRKRARLALRRFIAAGCVKRST